MMSDTMAAAGSELAHTLVGTAMMSIPVRGGYRIGSEPPEFMSGSTGPLFE
jgi:hypothetical protein